MSENSYNKIDFIIIIVLALLVAFIIGFNIIQVIDSKLSSVTINVPPQSCNLPPIYLTIDKDSNLKKINLNDIISTSSNESQYNNSINETNLENLENFENLNDIKQDNIENFENLNTDKFMDMNIDSTSSQYDNSTLENQSNKIINSQSYIENKINPNYNTVNDLPLLFSPDTDVPNKSSPSSKGYYSSKVKLIEDKNSPLMKLNIQNTNKINNIINKCTLNDSNKIPQVNNTFDGYNKFDDLKTDSYANVTSIGKSMLTPYVSYPVSS